MSHGRHIPGSKRCQLRQEFRCSVSRFPAIPVQGCRCRTGCAAVLSTRRTTLHSPQELVSSQDVFTYGRLAAERGGVDAGLQG